MGGPAAHEGWFSNTSSLTHSVKVKTVPAEWIKNGELLDRLSDEYVGYFQSCQEVLPEELDVATFCSGAEGATCVFDSAEHGVTKHRPGKPFRINHVWMSEIEEPKRNWAMRVNMQVDCCSFGDVRKLCKGQAECYRHDQVCVVAPAPIKVGGFSCKDFSPQSSHRDTSGRVLAQSSSAGKSADTWNGFLDLIDVDPTDLAVLENSDKIDSKQQKVSNLDIIMAQMASRFFEGIPLLCDSTEHGLSWARLRIFMVFVRVGAKMFTIKGYEAFFQKFIERVESCKRRPPSLLDVLHDNDAEDVRECFKALREKAVFFRSCGLAFGAVKARPETAESEWFEKVPERAQQIIACTQARWPSKLGVDVSQTIGRTPYLRLHGDVVVGPTILPGSCTFIFGDFQRLSTGEEALEGQGFPVAKFRALMRDSSNTFKQDLAGNAFGYPILLAIFHAFLFSVEWSTSKEPSTLPASSSEVDVSSALELLGQARKK